MDAMAHSLPGKSLFWAGSARPKACRVSRCPVTALAFPRTAHKESAGHSIPRVVLKEEPASRNGKVLNGAVGSASQVSFLGSEDDVAGQTLFLHLQQGTTVGQVVAMCNELAGRLGTQQRISGRLRPLHFATPSGRVDWDPVTEELPEVTWPLLVAEAAALKLSAVSVAVDSKEQLQALRAHLGDTVAYIQHQGHDFGSLSASF